MYQHLLVPMDGTTLSALNAFEAVSLARRLGARITFFTATADFGATADGALLRSVDPSRYVDELQGVSDAVLGKAMAEAQAQGVSCNRLARVCDQSARAIVEAAQELGCELIMMASRGQHGVCSWLHGSQTEWVLRQTRMAVLVTRIKRNEPLTTAERATSVILDEHRSLAVVVNCMRAMVADASRGGQLERTVLQHMRRTSCFPWRGAI